MPVLPALTPPARAPGSNPVDGVAGSCHTRTVGHVKSFTNEWGDGVAGRDGDPVRVVVVGAGFGGLAVVRGLAEDVASGRVHVTLVDRNNFHTFLPLLYQVATAGLNAADVAHSVRAVVKDQPEVDVVLGEVVAVDWDERAVRLAEGAPLPFDHVVVAAGSRANDFGTPGVAEHALSLYSLLDAVAVRNTVLARFEAADRDPALVDDGVLTFVIVGGGPTGVETAGALAELFDRVLRTDFPDLPVDRARVVLVEMADSLLTPFSPRSRRHAIDALRRRGVEVRLQTRVESVAADHVVLAGGEVVPCHTLVWAAGVRASAVAEAVGAETGPGGRLVVGPDCSLPGRPGGWAVGDVMHAVPVAGDSAGTAVPQLAPVAIQSGRLVADNIRCAVAGHPTRPFAYRDKGTMATIGRRAAVAELPVGPPLTGTAAWVAWLLLHLVMLVGFRNRISVLVNWAWNYLTWDRGPRILLRADPPAPGSGPSRR